MVEDFYEELQRLSHSLFAPLIVRSILRKTIALAIRSLDRWVSLGVYAKEGVVGFQNVNRRWLWR